MQTLHSKIQAHPGTSPQTSLWYKLVYDTKKALVLHGASTVKDWGIKQSVSHTVAHIVCIMKLTVWENDQLCLSRLKLQSDIEMFSRSCIFTYSITLTKPKGKGRFIFSSAFIYPHSRDFCPSQGLDLTVLSLLLSPDCRWLSFRVNMSSLLSFSPPVNILLVHSAIAEHQLGWEGFWKRQDVIVYKIPARDSSPSTASRTRKQKPEDAFTCSNFYEDTQTGRHSWKSQFGCCIRLIAKLCWKCFTKAYTSCPLVGMRQCSPLKHIRVTTAKEDWVDAHQPILSMPPPYPPSKKELKDKPHGDQESVDQVAAWLTPWNLTTEAHLGYWRIAF